VSMEIPSLPPQATGLGARRNLGKLTDAIAQRTAVNAT
jgi:hypothetical protein